MNDVKAKHADIKQSEHAEIKYTDPEFWNHVKNEKWDKFIKY